VQHADAEVNAAIAQLVGRRFGTIEVLAATGEVTTDPLGQPIVRVTLSVSDPADQTWPIEEVDQVQRETQRLLAERDPELPYAVVELLPETLEPDDDDQEEADTELTDALDSEPSDEPPHQT
jgi:hypothetical protein